MADAANRDENNDDPPAWQRYLFVTGPRGLTAALILIAISINFANVISRYVFNFALFWAEEIMIFLVVWCVFIGAAAVAFNGANLKMDLLPARFPAGWCTVINGAAAFAFIAGGGFAAWQSAKVVMLFAEGGSVSVTASVPMVIPHAALLIGLVLMVAAAIVRLRAYLRNRF